MSYQTSANFLIEVDTTDRETVAASIKDAFDGALQQVLRTINKQVFDYAAYGRAMSQWYLDCLGPEPRLEDFRWEDK